MKVIVSTDGKWVNPKQIVNIEFRQVGSTWSAFAIMSNDEEFEILNDAANEDAAKNGVISGGTEVIIIDDF